MKGKSLSDIKSPSLARSLLCFGGILAIIIVGVVAFELSMLVLLMTSIIWASLCAYSIGFKFTDIKNSMNKGIHKGLGASYIFILIGVVIAAFMESGTITSLVYYGLDIIHPLVFLPAGLILCSMMSVAVGTSFGTVGTAGVILIGVGAAQGVPLPIVAGMVISGAAFGDKLSPISDTTNLAAVAAETDLYKHIKSMLYTTIPTFLLCILLFTIVGFSYASDAMSNKDIAIFQQAIDDNFIVSLWSLLPIITLFLLSVNKIPAEPAMVTSVVVAIVIAILQQDRNLIEIMESLQGGYIATTGNTDLDLLVNRGGIISMLPTLAIGLFALALGGLLDAAGFLMVLLRGVLSALKTVISTMAATMCTGFLSCLSMGDGYIAIIVTSQLFKGKYKELNLQPHMLSRTVEESTTLITPIIPWTTAGAFYFGALGVPVLDYLPWAFLCYLNVFVSLILAKLGYGVFRVQDEEKLLNSAE